MSAKISPLAGKPATETTPVDVAALLAAYHDLRPDPSVPEQRVVFGTSGHRGSSFDRSFNAWHVQAVVQAICEYRRKEGVDGPVFVGIDTHALSAPAFESTLEVLAANGVPTYISAGGEYTPTPAVSHAILVFNHGRDSGHADGIVITPSHNPPESGGIKYNPPHGGPADTDATSWIAARANALIEGGLRDVKRQPYAQALKASTTQEYDFLERYVADLGNALDLDIIRNKGVRMGVDPLGGAGVHYWRAIGERYKLDLTVVSETVDKTFSFMSLDWDGRVRMDPSSAYAMQRLIGLKDKFDVAFACDTDHDRHGVVAPSTGLLPANHYLAAAAWYLFQNRPGWRADAAVGKTAVSTGLLDRIAAHLGRPLREVPVGFKYFVSGLYDGSLGFGCEESAGASFLSKDGGAWSTDKDGIVAALLAGEMTARLGKDPGEIYRGITGELGDPANSRIDAPASHAQKAKLSKLAPDQVESRTLAGDPIVEVVNQAGGQPIGGIKVISAEAWFAARPSGTEDIYKVYGESFRGNDHLQKVLAEAQAMVDKALS
ncbi:MAG: phosphoglucomutase (alpha-D-glucose-1,6-bisphosphate-dependent) [Luteibacter sp.]|uniref:phosphoglucomutase (alpha-D-glucose-1,6-bisphosphate-dependent) n=1 Tax=Luteibacter sp. TaxID=1886636 RepID=UPI002806BA94|nr:phosphoglucomutase (alpha-D-glucose-1,6-bisphosphate-dependent) [Luteibacter sp.]MDQ7995072.1 phosphoglucomutase (alpha-D-glucose-1,6-bisphosphate-dependent) [Luteibacter sp.]MDQ8047413.1 phosphoglucomutase (alpha-D-glucose-1,6-bisphosphate-dependent) [Luteibacter sp.]